MSIPESHPRYESLRVREMLVAGFLSGAVAPEGVMAHGRGEAFDYILGERSGGAARAAARAAAAALLLSARPVISVNGNVAALCGKEVVELSRASGARIEVNLFYDSMDRRRIIIGMMRRLGAQDVLGLERDFEMGGLESARRLVSSEGIARADTVLVPLEDGDRAQALADAGKRVIAIDLNPLSRTSQVAGITVVDNITRALPLLAAYCREMAGYAPARLAQVADFDNGANLKGCIAQIKGWLEEHIDA